MRDELLPMLRDELAPDKLRREGFLDPAAVSRIVEEHVHGHRDHRKQLWTLLVFERWLASFGEAAAAAPAASSSAVVTPTGAGAGAAAG